MQKYDEIIQVLNKTIEYYPYSESICCLMGDAFNKMEKYLEATNYYEKALEINQRLEDVRDKKQPLKNLL